jgi:hypothetical protein
MAVFQYYNIITIIQNFDNLKINILIHNQSKNFKINPITDIELQKIVVWGCQMVKQYGLHILQTYFPQQGFPIKPKVLTLSEVIDSQNVLNTEQIVTSETEIPPTNKNFEFCFAMKDFPWDRINNKYNLKAKHMILNGSAYHMTDERYMWIGDTGASCQFINDDSAYIQWRNIHDAVGVCDGTFAIATKIGTVCLEDTTKKWRE